MESVQVMESCLVAPKEATPRKGLWLSSHDVALANVGHTPTVCLYSSGATFFDVPRLKEALAKALVAFYPLAGRLGVDDDGRVEIRCNGEGALFVVARSRCLTAQDADFSKPSPLLKRMFVPSIDDDIEPLMLAAQVTFLRCAAVVLGVSMHHAAVDATAASQFMQTWSALYRDDDDDGGTAAVAPCHDRTLLRARSPPVVHPDAFSVLYYPKVTSSWWPSSNLKGQTVTEVFPISRDQLVTLKRLCGGGSGAAAAKASTFVSLSALVWQCMSVVRRPRDAIMRLSFPVNARRYVRPRLPTRYFGNAFVSLCATGAAADIASEALPSVAARISGAMAKMDDDLVRSAIDCVELADEESWPRSGNLLPETDLRIVSWLNMQFGLDLGCGGPQVVTGANTIGHGLVYLMDDNGPANHRGVGIVVRMEPERINEFQRLLYASIAKKHAYPSSISVSNLLV